MTTRSMAARKVASSSLGRTAGESVGAPWPLAFRPQEALEFFAHPLLSRCGKVSLLFHQPQTPHGLADMPPHAFASALDVLSRNRFINGGMLFLVDLLPRGQIHAFIRLCDTCPDVLGNKI